MINCNNEKFGQFYYLMLSLGSPIHCVRRQSRDYHVKTEAHVIHISVFSVLPYRFT